MAKSKNRKEAGTVLTLELFPLITIKLADGLRFQTFIAVEKVNSLTNNFPVRKGRGRNRSKVSLKERLHEDEIAVRLKEVLESGVKK
jgi:hypothetical protein